MSLTYNKIIQLSKEFSQAHYFLKSFGNGSNWDTALKAEQASLKYPRMWMEDNPSPFEQSIETFSFRIGFLSQVEQVENENGDRISVNRNEVISDMRQIAKDFLSFWVQDHDNEIRIDRNINITVVEDVTPDKLAGVYADYTFKQPFTYNACIIPKT